MGPRLKGRGSGIRRELAEVLQGASMGPRLKGRGSAAEASDNSYNDSGLQWGHVSKDVEVLFTNCCAVMDRIASMGPRLKGRGSHEGRCWYISWVWLQWGHVSKDVEV